MRRHRQSGTRHHVCAHKWVLFTHSCTRVTHTDRQVQALPSHGHIRTQRERGQYDMRTHTCMCTTNSVSQTQSNDGHLPRRTPHHTKQIHTHHTHREQRGRHPKAAQTRHRTPKLQPQTPYHNNHNHNHKPWNQHRHNSPLLPGVCFSHSTKTGSRGQTDRQTPTKGVGERHSLSLSLSLCGGGSVRFPPNEISLPPSPGHQRTRTVSGGAGEDDHAWLGAAAAAAAAGCGCGCAAGPGGGPCPACCCCPPSVYLFLHPTSFLWLLPCGSSFLVGGGGGESRLSSLARLSCLVPMPSAVLVDTPLAASTVSAERVVFLYCVSVCVCVCVGAHRRPMSSSQDLGGQCCDDDCVCVFVFVCVCVCFFVCVCLMGNPGGSGSGIRQRRCLHRHCQCHRLSCGAADRGRTARIGHLRRRCRSRLGGSFFSIPPALFVPSSRNTSTSTPHTYRFTWLYIHPHTHTVFIHVHLHSHTHTPHVPPKRRIVLSIHRPFSGVYVCARWF